MLYKKEILGRLFGGNLTPRQYEMLTREHGKEDIGTQRMRDVNNEIFLNNRDIIRLIEEEYEKIRRQNVMSGEWEESESNDRLQSLIEEHSSKMPGQSKFKRAMRDYKTY